MSIRNSEANVRLLWETLYGIIMWANMDLWYHQETWIQCTAQEFDCVLTFSMAFNQRPVNKEGEPSEPDTENVGWLWLYKH